MTMLMLMMHEDVKSYDLKQLCPDTHFAKPTQLNEKLDWAVKTQIDLPAGREEWCGRGHGRSKG